MTLLVGPLLLYKGGEKEWEERERGEDAAAEGAGRRFQDILVSEVFEKKLNPMACYYIVISSTHLRDGQLRNIKGVFRGPIGTHGQRNTVRTMVSTSASRMCNNQSLNVCDSFVILIRQHRINGDNMSMKSVRKSASPHLNACSTT